MEPDHVFLSRLGDSVRGSYAVANYLRKTYPGLDVLINSIQVRPDVKVRDDYADRGDIELRWKAEVKKRNLKWTSAENYPYHTVMIDEVGNAHAALSRGVYAYYILSGDENSLAIIKGTTSPHWTVGEFKDEWHPEGYKAYLVEKEHCEWVTNLKGDFGI
jgi:hypothetical protein